ncbi:DUF1543 domain-containing protein [Flavobacterium nackdongense]|uniref:DUF1543 domain-containing protein n=1 Tax=Flavobacterium nackdongense TaxID=2547394 RepID=A0A4P6YAF9_9FLAO|nr:DUF1543 domain-containing protein [Flavobacterium nackdongense]QBN20111.1 DUF1543 domain-containing protein [Flavobacterium nackdongense]
MSKELKLYMVILGCKPEGRYTEQHDVFFGIGKNLKDLVPQIKAFWPEAKGKIHIDAWREVKIVDNYSIEIVSKKLVIEPVLENLFFINLGGYKENEFEEYHYKILTVAKNLSVASKNAKATTFYKHCGFKGATSHIDDKYGIDVDDIYNVSDILSKQYKELYSLKLSPIESTEADVLHIGYLKLDKIHF